MAGFDLSLRGVSFDMLRRAITAIYFQYEGMSEAQFDEAMESVVPMQHNWQNPLQPGAKDTIIQYWINSDERYTQDRIEGNFNITTKVANCTLRFIGVKAEQWAKAFHHLTKRQQVVSILSAYCNARQLEYVGPIVVSNIDYFGTANATKAFTLTFQLAYEEILDFTEGSGGDRLEYISFAAGQIDKEVAGGMQ